jgi:hypothetical protein
MEIIKSEDTEEIGIVLSKEEAEALGFALSRFSYHNTDLLSKIVNKYLTEVIIDYYSEILTSKYKRAIGSIPVVKAFSLRVP